MPESKPVLEVNAEHALLKGLGDDAGEDLVADVARVLLDQAYLLENLALANPADFVVRLNRLISKGLVK